MTPEVYVKSLERYHAPLVYEHWPYKSCTTVDYVANEIDRLPSAGVFLKDGDRLVSWVMEHPPSGTSRLHTLEQYRRCGYGRLAVLYFSKRSAQAGRQPFANIVVGNESSVHLFRSMGFRFWGGVQTTGLFPGVVLWAFTLEIGDGNQHRSLCKSNLPTICLSLLSSFSTRLKGIGIYWCISA